METKKFLDGEGLKTLWSEITSLQSDYNETDETSPNYIKNKPFTIDVIPEEVIEEFTFTTSDTIDSSTGLPTMQYVQLFSDLTIGQKMNLQFTYPELAAATGQPQYDDNGNIITKTVRYENITVGNFADAMGSQFLDSPAIMMGPGAMIATLPESIQAVAIPNDDIVFVYSNATLANGTQVPILITALVDKTSATMWSTQVVNASVLTYRNEEISLEATRENGIALQSDWDEYDNTKSDFIRNKPFGESVVKTPMNEFYLDTFDTIIDDTVGILNRSLGIEEGKTYPVTLWTTKGETSTIIMTCINELEGFTIPEGSKMLFWSDDSNSLYFILDKANFINEEIVYSENNAIIPFINDNVYKMIIDGLPNSNDTYDRIVTKKINSKYLLEADQVYSPNSENAQSGIAVKEAITKVTNSLPSSFVTGLYTPTTLGDQHIKVNSTTSGKSIGYNLYTEGIGLNKNLKTTNKDTIVDAINESIDNLDSYIKEHDTKTTVATSFQEKIYVDGTEILLSKNKNPYNIKPYKYSINLNTRGGSQVYGTQSDRFIDLSNGIIYSFNEGNGKLTEKAISNKDVLTNNMSQIKKVLTADNYYYYYLYEKYNRWNGNTTSRTVTDDNYTLFLVQLKDDTYGSFIIHKTGVCTELTLLDKTIEGTYIPIGSCYNGSSSYSQSSSGSYTTTIIRSYGNLKGFYPTNLEKPGKLTSTLTNRVYGSDSYSNAQIIGVSGTSTNRTFFRALQEDGTEIVNMFEGSETSSAVYQGIDNNEHSSYCQDTDGSNNIICLTSNKEVLCRSGVNGSVVWRKPVNTTSDLFTKNLQYIALVAYDTNLYINDGNVLYCLDYSKDNPVMTQIDSSETNLYNVCIYKDNLFQYDNQNDQKTLNVYTLREAFFPGSELFKNVQADYNQTDLDAFDYIKNKPITAEYTTNYLTKDKSIPVAQQMGNSAFVVEDQFINLVIGEKYDIDMNVTSTIDNSTTTHTFKNVECVDMCDFWKQTSPCPGIVIAPELMLSLYPKLSYATLSDGLVFMYTNNFNGAAYDETKCITCVGEMDETGAANTNITIAVNVSQTGVEGEISEPYAKFLQADWSEQDETKIGYIKNKPSTSEYYFFNLQTFIDAGFGEKNFANTVKNPSSNAYYDYVAINIVLGLGGMDNDKFFNITNIPYETLCINNYPYLVNKSNFKNVGLKSPVFKEMLNYDGVIWFDALEEFHKKLLTYECESLCVIGPDSSSVIAGFVIYGQVQRSGAPYMHPNAQLLITLWEAVLNDPDTQVVIEYEGSNNIPHKEGQLVMPVAEVGEVE